MQDFFGNQYRREDAQPGQSRDRANAGSQGTFGLVVPPVVTCGRVQIRGKDVASSATHITGQDNQQMNQIGVQG